MGGVEVNKRQRLYTKKELKEIRKAKGYTTQNGWGQDYHLTDAEAKAKKIQEINSRHVHNIIKSKLKEYDCDVSFIEDEIGIIKLKNNKPDNPEGFEKFVTWFRDELLPSAYLLEDKR